MISKINIFKATILLSFISFSNSAHAVLGGDAASTAVIGKSLPGVVKMAKRAAVQKATTSENLYTVQETDSPGTIVREFITRDGKVFAVAWQGIVEPDLAVLFGDSYSEYQAEQSKRQPSHERHAVTETTHLIVRRSGHLRDRRGTAYIPSLVPDGVNAGDLE